MRNILLVTSAAMHSAVRWATALWTRPQLWQRIMCAGMRADVSWNRSAEDHEAGYEQALGHAG